MTQLPCEKPTLFKGRHFNHLLIIQDVLSAQGMKVIANAAVLAHTAWTPTTLTGTNLYMRDHKMMVALDLK